MRIKLLTLALLLACSLSACAAQPAATAPATPTLSNTSPTPAATAASAPATFKTPIGDLVFVSARFVAEANGVKPAEGCNLLLVGLSRPDGSSIDVGQFQDAQMQIFIRDTDGSETLSTMGGLVDGKFVIGFQAPVTIKTYNLVWGDNPTLEIHPAE